MVEYADQSQTQASSSTQHDHIAECIKAIADYRGKRVSKWAAIAQISTALSSAAATTNSDQRATAGETYLAMLDEHDRILASAHTRGRQGLRQSDSDEEEPEENPAGEDRARRSLSRSRSPSSKRHKVDETLYAWKVQELLAPAPLSQNLEHTRSMVQNYTADLKHALWSLQSSSVLPPFPKSEWKHVLAGTAVNLDVVFSGLFSTLAEDKSTASIGDFDLSIGGGKPSKHVQSHGDWTIAWNATFAAILCAFPHRAMELRIYSEYILQFFGAFPHSHSKVINLDKAIRRYVGEVRHLELADVGRFRHLEARYLQDDGAGNQTGPRKEKEISKAGRRSNEVCRQWNSGTCNRRASECRFRHLCSKCRASHPSTECPKKD
jgi:hypothetical protein